MRDVDIIRKVRTGEITIDPFNEEQLGSNSYDVSIYHVARLITHSGLLDPTKEVPDSVEIFLPINLKPRQSMICLTEEIIGCDDKHVGLIFDRSNFQRLPIATLSYGFVDSGYIGPLSVRITNIGNFDIVIHPKMRLFQVAFMELTDSVRINYIERKDSKNVGQSHMEVPNYQVDKMWRNISNGKQARRIQ